MKKNFGNWIKSGLAGILVSATLITGTGCATKPVKLDNEKINDDTRVELTNKDEAVSARSALLESVNNTFSNYVTVEGETAGKPYIDADGVEKTKRLGCVSAPNGDNVAWFGKEYISVYQKGKAIVNSSNIDIDAAEAAEMYVSIKDSLLEIVNNKNHKIEQIGYGVYKVDDNDCNVYVFQIKDGKIVTINDTYTEFKTGKTTESTAYVTVTNKAEFNQALKNALAELNKGLGL